MQVYTFSDNWERESLNISNYNNFITIETRNNDGVKIDTIYEPLEPVQDTLNVYILKLFVPFNEEIVYFRAHERISERIEIGHSGLYYSLDTWTNNIGKSDGMDYRKFVSDIYKRQDSIYPFDLDKFMTIINDKWPNNDKNGLAYICLERFDISQPKQLWGKPGIWEDNSDIGVYYYNIKNTEGLFSGGSEISEHAHILGMKENMQQELSYAGQVGGKEYTTSPLFALYDISRISYRLKLPKNVYIETLSLSFGSPSEFIFSVPVPDIVDESAIWYKDQNKIKQLQEHGLSLTVKFPLMENLQTMKSFLFTSILAFLFALLYNLIKSLLAPYISEWSHKRRIGWLLVFIALLLATIIYAIK